MIQSLQFDWTLPMHVAHLPEYAQYQQHRHDAQCFQLPTPPCCHDANPASTSKNLAALGKTTTSSNRPAHAADVLQANLWV
jgi:hypothetical protein